MGEFTGQLDVYIVPGKCRPVELKGIDWLVFSFFLKTHGMTLATYRDTGEKTNKQTNPSEASLYTHPLSCYFLNQGMGQRGKRAILVFASQ